ncbi:flagellin [Roseibium aggregatum]|uniref:flagellin n=1 Tax=Roseibium aggregatum TaxID=187304 RepID=UPI003A984B84
MAMRVSTFGQSSTVLQNALTTQAKLAEKQVQQSSGIVSSTYADLGTDSGKLIDLEVSVTRAKSYISAAEQAVTRIEEMYSALSGINDLLTEARADLAAASVDTGDGTDTLQATATSYLQEVAALLNTQYQGRYLFAGSETTEAPVDLNSYTAVSLTDVNTDYYQGDDTTIAVKVGEDRTVSYGVTAEAPGLEMAMRTLSYLAETDPLDTDELEDISALLIEAQDAVIALRSGLGLKSATLERIAASEEDYVAAASDLASETLSVDLAQVAVDAATYETQLEASYAALGTLTDLSLLDYLR